MLVIANVMTPLVYFSCKNVEFLELELPLNLGRNLLQIVPFKAFLEALDIINPGYNATETFNFFNSGRHLDFCRKLKMLIISKHIKDTVILNQFKKS